MRIGHGYDVHRMVPGRACVLCGVEIPSETGPMGHSDADVAAHALMDALLGAAALGDIGRHFPDTDERWRGVSSMELLRRVTVLVAERGYTLGNADVTIVVSRPKLSPYIQRMRQTLADNMGVPIDRISVKATTEEGLGFTDGPGIAAHAVALLTEAPRVKKL